MISHVVLLGGFAASDWLFSKVNELLSPLGLDIVRPENFVNKAVSDSAISFYLYHLVRTRVSKVTFGVNGNIRYNPNDPDHQSRSHKAYTCRTSGDKRIPVFSIILPKNTQVSETKEFRKTYRHRSFSTTSFRSIKHDFLCYRGNIETPRWKDVDTDNYSTLCSIEADLSRAPVLTRPKVTGAGSFYLVKCDIILLFGMTELQAQLAWTENGIEKRSAAKIIYEPDTTNDDP